ncbi:MAG: hypothetical protein WC402_04150 [Candidatus Pacearchaeota archaeon]|jgi:hypothetical protein
MKFLNAAGGVFEGDLEKTLKDSNPNFLNMPKIDSRFLEYGLDNRSNKPYLLIVYGLLIEEPSAYSILTAVASESDETNKKVFEELKRTLNIPMKEVTDPSLSLSNQVMAAEYRRILSPGMSLKKFIEEAEGIGPDYRNN